MFCARKEERADGTAGESRRGQKKYASFQAAVQYIPCAIYHDSAESRGLIILMETDEGIRRIYSTHTEGRCIWLREQISPDQSVAALPLVSFLLTVVLTNVAPISEKLAIEKHGKMSTTTTDQR